MPTKSHKRLKGHLGFKTEDEILRINQTLDKIAEDLKNKEADQTKIEVQKDENLLENNILVENVGRRI